MRYRNLPISHTWQVVDLHSPQHSHTSPKSFSPTSTYGHLLWALKEGKKSNTKVDGIRKMSSQATVNHMKGRNNHPPSG